MMGPDAWTSTGGSAHHPTAIIPSSDSSTTAAAASAAEIDATQAADAAAAEGHAAGYASTILRFAGPDDTDLQDSRTAQEIGYAAAYDASYYDETGAATVTVPEELKPWAPHVPQSSALEEQFACGFDAGMQAAWNESLAAGALDGAKDKLLHAAQRQQQQLHGEHDAKLEDCITSRPSTCAPTLSGAMAEASQAVPALGLAALQQLPDTITTPARDGSYVHTRRANEPNQLPFLSPPMAPIKATAAMQRRPDDETTTVTPQPAAAAASAAAAFAAAATSPYFADPESNKRSLSANPVEAMQQIIDIVTKKPKPEEDEVTVAKATTLAAAGPAGQTIRAEQ